MERRGRRRAEQLHMAEATIAFVSKINAAEARY
jgi:hypothetical protein